MWLCRPLAVLVASPHWSHWNLEPWPRQIFMWLDLLCREMTLSQFGQMKVLWVIRWSVNFLRLSLEMPHSAQVKLIFWCFFSLLMSFKSCHGGYFEWAYLADYSLRWFGVVVEVYCRNSMTGAVGLQQLCIFHWNDNNFLIHLHSVAYNISYQILT